MVTTARALVPSEGGESLVEPPIPKLTVETLGTVQRISRKQAAIRQIEGAIVFFRRGEYACAITLSLAAEDQIQDTNEPHVFKSIRERAPHIYKQFNRVRDWLKHCNPKEPEEMDIYEFEVVVAILRATTKFFAAYQEKPIKIEAFDNWAKTKLRLF